MLATMAKRKRTQVNTGDTDMLRRCGAQIRQARKARKWSQAKLGRLVGLTGAMVSLIEHGENTTPTNIARLAEVLGLSLDALFQLPAGTASRVQQRLAGCPPDVQVTIAEIVENVLRHIYPPALTPLHEPYGAC